MTWREFAGARGHALNSAHVPRLVGHQEGVLVLFRNAPEEVTAR